MYTMFYEREFVSSFKSIFKEMISTLVKIILNIYTQQFH